MRGNDQIRAICRNCMYPLRGLDTPRCPECGTPFDPSDRLTMNLTSTRLGGYLSQPLRADLHKFQIIAMGAMVWGFALMPGGLIFGICGLIAALICATFRWAHRSAQHAYLSHYGAVPPMQQLSPRWRRARLIILILAVLTLGDLPGLALSYIGWPIANSYFNHEPMYGSPYHFRWFGCTVVWSVEANPSGVTITAIGGGECEYRYDSKRDGLVPQGPIAGRLTLFSTWFVVSHLLPRLF